MLTLEEQIETPYQSLNFSWRFHVFALPLSAKGSTHGAFKETPALKMPLKLEKKLPDLLALAGTLPNQCRAGNELKVYVCK